MKALQYLGTNHVEVRFVGIIEEINGEANGYKPGRPGCCLSADILRPLLCLQDQAFQRTEYDGNQSL